MIIKHPTLPVEMRVPDSHTDRWAAAGWVIDASEIEVDDKAPDPCPTCGAEDDDPCVTFHTNQPTKRHANRDA